MTTLKDVYKWEPFIGLLKNAKVTRLALEKWMAVTSTAKDLNVLRGIKPTTQELNLIKGLRKTGVEINHKIDSYEKLSITTGLKGSLPTPAYIQGRNSLIAGGPLTANDATGRKLDNNHLMITVNSLTLSTELMPNVNDRTFAGASAWANVSLSAYNETGDLTITANAANQYCTCPVASAPTVVGRQYTMTFDVANLVSTWTIKSFDGTQTIGTVTADGTALSISWTATTTGGYRIVSNSTTSSADFDNFTLSAVVQGQILVTGDSMSESSAVPKLADTEYLVIDRTGTYQTHKKWYRTTSIVVLGSGITAINYDISVLGYWDAANNNVDIGGYRIQLTPTVLNAATTFQFQMWKVQDDGDGRCTIVPMEDIALKNLSTAPPATYVDDNIRTGTNNRDYSTAQILTVGLPGVMKQGDFDDYFTNGENILRGGDKDEGLIIKITWVNIDYITGVINYRHIL